MGFRIPEPRLEPKEGIDYIECKHETTRIKVDPYGTGGSIYLYKECSECEEVISEVQLTQGDLSEIFDEYEEDLDNDRG